MTVRAGLALVKRNVTRSRSHFVFAAIGLVVGTATLAFFLSLSFGVRDRVLNRLYPVNQVEFQVEQVRVFGLGVEVPTRLDAASLQAIRRLPGVAGVYPKQRTKFPARLWGGADIFGYEARLEAFFDGIDPTLLREELRASEVAVLGPEARDATCTGDADCGSGGRCRDGTCLRATYWDAFRDQGGNVACRSDAGCAEGRVCRQGRCAVPCGDGAACAAGTVCAGGECLAPCAADRDCDSGETCAGSGEGRACRRLLCRLDRPEIQLQEDWEALRGTVVPTPGVNVTDLPGRCPEGTYCAAASVVVREGACEAPMPVVLSPFILDVYNTVVTTALNLNRLSGLEVMLGLRFAILFGESYFAADDQPGNRVVRRCRVVGFSGKAMEFGVTAPLAYATRANTMLRGRAESSEYTSVVVETERNEYVPSLVEDAQVLGLTLAPRSEEGRKAANMLLVLTIVFAMVSLVILGISAINITHTFLMLVTERRAEIAVYRAVGATLLDIRLLILCEAVLLGVLGGALGVGASWFASRAVNVLASGILGRLPGSPSDLFVFSGVVVAAGLGCAIVFSIVGAWIPARKAAKTDPAEVLSQG